MDSSPASSSSSMPYRSSSPIAEDDLNSEWGKLESLRQDVSKNLSLRPIHNANDFSLNSDTSPPPTAIRRTFKGLPPPLAIKTGSTGSNVLTDSSGDTASTGTSSPSSPTSDDDDLLVDSVAPVLHSPSDIIAHYSSQDDYPDGTSLHTTNSSSSSSLSYTPVSVSRLAQQPPLLLLDMRPPEEFAQRRIRGSINLSVPTLILKRWKRYLDQNDRSALVQAVGTSVRGLATFVVGGEEDWERVLSNGKWKGDVVVYDAKMDESDPLRSSAKPSASSSSTPTPSWLLLAVLSTTSTSERMHYLQGGLRAVDSSPSSSRLLITGGSAGGAVSDASPEAVYSTSPTQDPVPPLPPPGTTTSSPPLSLRSKKSTIRVNVPGGYPGIMSPDSDATSTPDPETTAFRMPPNTVPNAKRARPPTLNVNPTSSAKDESAISANANEISIPQSQSTMISTPPAIAPFAYAYNYDASPSPSPSTTTGNLPFPRTPTASSPGIITGGSTVPPIMRSRSNTAMLPKLTRLDTKSRERLAPINTSNLASTSKNPPAPPPPLPENAASMPPKLSLRTQPFKSATLAAPIASPKVGGFGLKLHLPPSPSKAAFGNITSPTNGVDFQSPLSGTSVFFTPVQTPSEFAQQYPFTPADSSYHSFASLAALHPHMQQHQPPHSPTTPLTARPPASPTSLTSAESECAVPPFIVSTILPGALYLGPEVSNEEQLEELLGLGVKRVLNMAIECEPDDYGLDLDKRFERYCKIPMRDTVEEDRMAKALKEVCEFVDDARLHSSPVYVHCKAGKSRSVTAVMAYLIHANHWPLSRAYAFVNERRKGVSPNIGFVSELMNFEELKLGNKSVGVHHPSPNDGPERRPHPHARDSLPPHAFTALGGGGNDVGTVGPPVNAGGAGGAAVGAGAGEEMEIKDAEGRYRHARRAPVDELTLQPLRRVSKAGLETTW